MLIQILNGKVHTPQGWLDNGSVVIKDNKILEVLSCSLPIQDAEIVDAKGAYIVPGGIELHVHGGGGRDFMEGTEEAFRVAVDAHMKHGTTSIYPTLSSSTKQMIEDAAITCGKLMAEPNSPILGLHLEGPYFNLKKAGAQMPEIIRNAEPEEYVDLIDKYPCIKRWDAAPEMPGAIEFGKYASQHGVVVAIGHTAAGYDDVKAAHDAGYTHVTHFYNAMTSVHNNREFKEAGTIESVYCFEDLNVECVADGIHVPPVMLHMVYKGKGVEHMCAITDALACAASDSDVAFDPRVVIEDGVCKLSDRSALAGSIATMDRLIRTLHQLANIPLFDTIRLISESPAKIMGIYDRKGSLEKGKDADILLLDNDLNLLSVYAMGKLVDGTNKL